MNKISDARRAQIEALLHEGHTVRQIARDMGADRKTVRRCRDRLAEEMELICPCGRELTHFGWCRVRVERSPARLEFVANWARARNNRPQVLEETRAVDPKHRKVHAMIDALPVVMVAPPPPTTEKERIVASHVNRGKRALARKFKDRPKEDLATILARSPGVVVKRFPPGKHAGWKPEWLPV